MSTRQGDNVRAALAASRIRRLRQLARGKRRVMVELDDRQVTVCLIYGVAGRTYGLQ